MALLGLCHDDPLVRTLRDVFGANIVRVPEERVKPLTVLASDGKSTTFRGELAPLLGDGAPVPVDVHASAMASLAGRRSRSVKLDLGLKILGGFLQALGVPSAGFGAQLAGASEVSFSFQDVHRFFVDINELGHALAGRRVDRQNPAAALFFQDDWSFLVVDSAITSRDFDLRVETTTAADFHLDVPAIQQLVAQATAAVEVQAASERELRFQGTTDLAFAFTCVRLYLGADGVITSMPPADVVPALAARAPRFGAPGHVVHYSPDRVLLTAEPAMVDLEEAGLVHA